MDLNALGFFVAAAEAGSLSAGARRLGVPLPTFSRRVRRLEDDLGLRLLERGPRGLALTSAGTRLLADSASALDALSQAEQRLHDASGVAGTLRVSTPPNFEPMWSVLSEFGQSYPSVRFDVFVTDRRVDLVADGLDVAIRLGEGGHRSYVGRTLARYRHLVVAAPALLAVHPIRTRSDLHQAPCVCWRSDRPPTWSLGGQDVRLDPLLQTNDYPHLLRLALSGAAVTELPPFLVREALQRGRLAHVLPLYPLPEQHLRALAVARRSMSPLVRQFLDFAAVSVPAALGLQGVNNERSR